MAIQKDRSGRNVRSSSTLFWFYNYLNISNLISPVLHSLGYFTQSPLPPVHIRVLHQADVPHLNIPLVRVPLLTDEKGGEVQLQPHLPELVGNGLDQQKPGFNTSWIISKPLISFKRAATYSARTSTKEQGVGGQVVSAGLFTWFDSNGPLFDQVPHLGQQGEHLIQAQLGVPQHRKHGLLHTLNKFHHYLRGSILVLRIGHDKFPI